MARECNQCGKTSMIVTNRKLLRGNYNPTSRTRKYPNLQWRRNKQGERVKMCTQCIKTFDRA